MQVDLLLNCGHIIIIPVESVILLPKIGLEIKCAECKQDTKVSRVGTPYNPKREQRTGDNEMPIMGDR